MVAISRCVCVSLLCVKQCVIKLHVRGPFKRGRPYTKGESKGMAKAFQVKLQEHADLR